MGSIVRSKFCLVYHLNHGPLVGTPDLDIAPIHHIYQVGTHGGTEQTAPESNKPHNKGRTVETVARRPAKIAKVVKVVAQGPTGN